MILSLFRVWFRLVSWLWPGWAASQAFDLFITPKGKVKTALPAVFQQATRLELNELGDQCVGWRWNSGGSPRILVLHGFSSSARNFGHLIESLTEAGAQVVAFDAPAHGESAGKKIHSLRYRALIQRLRMQFGPFDGYIAHSFGGLSVSLALDEMPPRPTERLVLIAPATETRSALKQLQTTLRLSDSIMNRIDKLIEQRSGRPVSWFSVNRVMKELNCRVFWVHDQQDDITPYEDTLPTRSLAKPTIRFVETNGLGHRRIYRDPFVCKEMLDFLLNTDLR
jgi:pimeloyl-ACP methyl ester carboxylesterase